MAWAGLNCGSPLGTVRSGRQQEPQERGLGLVSRKQRAGVGVGGMQSTWFCDWAVWTPWQQEEIRLTSLGQAHRGARGGGGYGKGEGWSLAPGGAHSTSPPTPACIAGCLPGPCSLRTVPTASTVLTAISRGASFDCYPLLEPSHWVSHAQTPPCSVQPPPPPRARAPSQTRALVTWRPVLSTGAGPQAQNFWFHQCTWRITGSLLRPDAVRDDEWLVPDRPRLCPQHCEHFLSAPRSSLLSAVSPLSPHSGPHLHHVFPGPTATRISTREQGHTEGSPGGSTV